MSQSEDVEGQKKVPRYLQFYKQEWEKLPIFKGWLSSVPESRHRAYCRYCQKEFRAHRTDLRSHAKSRKHQKATEDYFSKDKAPSEPVPQKIEATPEKKPIILKCSPIISEAVSEEGISGAVSDNISDEPDCSPPSPDSVEVLELIHPKKVRAYMKGKEKRWRISTQVLDLVRGIPVTRLGVALLYETEECWSCLGDGITDSDGQWYYYFAHELRAGRYKLHFEIKKYFILGLHDTCYPYIEVVFDIPENCQQFHVPLLVSPFGYMVYRGGK